jgi:hypothetical protein
MRLCLGLLLTVSVMLQGVAVASCSGEEGCDECYDIQTSPTSEQRSCLIDQDCSIIPDGCGGWLSVRSDKANDVKNQISMVRPSCDDSVRPKCIFSTCKVKGRYEKNLKDKCS